MPRRYVGRSRGESSTGFLNGEKTPEQEHTVDLYNVLEPHNKRPWSVEIGSMQKRRSVASASVDTVTPRTEGTSVALHSGRSERESQSTHPMTTRRRSLMDSELAEIVESTYQSVSGHGKRKTTEDEKSEVVAGSSSHGRRRCSTLSNDDDMIVEVVTDADVTREMKVDIAIVENTADTNGGRRGSEVGPTRRRRSSLPARHSPYTSSPRSTNSRGMDSLGRSGEKTPVGESTPRSVKDRISTKIDYVTSTLKDLEFAGLKKRTPNRKINPVYTDPRFEAEVLHQIETPKKSGLLQKTAKKMVRTLSNKNVTNGAPTPTMTTPTTPNTSASAPNSRYGSPENTGYEAMPSSQRLRRRSQSVPNVLHYGGAGPIKDSVLVSACTWNMNGKTPPGSITPMVEPGKYHIYVVGTEECEQKSKSVRMISKKKWEQKIEETLGEDYVRLAGKAMQSIHIVCFVRRDLYMLISDVQTASVGTGLGNFYGNKGAVAVSFQLESTTFLFISTHLAAHQDEVSARNANYWKINKELGLWPKNFPDLARSEDAVERFHNVFWMGDLNYRVNMSRPEADSCLLAGQLPTMFAQDQLALEMAEGRVFPNFIEGNINFPPTYKYDIDSEVYDSSEKQRVPSWTDRILHRAARTIRQLDYRAVATMKTSDHRPVCATFLVNLGRRSLS